MSNLLWQFCWDTLGISLGNYIDAPYHKDSSEMVVVDGEEGDHGKVKYIWEGQLLAIETVHGGDNSEFAYTPYGFEFLSKIFLDQTNRKLEASKKDWCV